MNAKVKDTMKMIGDVALVALTVRSLGKLPKVEISPVAKGLLVGVMLIDGVAGNVIKEKVKDVIGRK